ncbi:FecR family protein [Mucilaginibacter sp. RCC_168]|uniref:FecR family protein n=1 Tax=unclassified Mucilaginibacter TaxID=2617802 RepID=UPI000880B2E3|nr:FecR family protein [Mucilaginibacter sp. OK268]SDP13464.1 FecR family protein [Mucilaginibacter sp. OK268]
MAAKENQERIWELARKWQDDSITEDERKEFNDWYKSFDDTGMPDLLGDSPEALKERMLRSVMKMKSNSDRAAAQTTFFSYRVAAAAIVLLCLSVGAYLFLRPSIKYSAHKIAVIKTDASPGRNKAILTLSNGEKIDLDQAQSGILAREKSAIVKKTKDGRLAYNNTALGAGPNNGEMLYNTVTTPRAGQYQITLSDGSDVWLNACSSISFPLAFGENERQVKISGEVYFEVKKNKHLPFRVISNNQIVEVLGTHFNINAYVDESVVTTTLLEGSVKISQLNQPSAKFLKPGQQSIIQPGKAPINIQQVDTEIAVAWKNGYFRFEHADLQSLMRQFSRWYDVDVSYEGAISDDFFEGQIPRSSKLSEALKILELGDVHFKIKDKKLIVLP